MKTRTARLLSGVWPPVAAVAVFYIAAVYVRVVQYGVLWFVHLGREMLESSDTSSVLTPELGWQSEIGYDGQYYYALAVDPARAVDYMTDNAGIVYARPFYPGLSRAVSLGDVGLVPYAMLLINLAAVLLGCLAIAGWLKRNGVSPWFSLLYGLYPGIVYSVFRDLTEPLAYGLVAVALWLFDPHDGRRVRAAAAVLAVAALTRETVVIFALVGALALWACNGKGSPWSRERMRGPLAFLGATVAPLLVWKLFITLAVGEPAQGSPGGLRAIVPFYGIFSYWPWEGEHPLIVLAVVLPTMLALCASVFMLWSVRGKLVALLLALNAAAFVVFLPRAVYVDFGAASRSATGVVLATIACVPVWNALHGRSRIRYVSLAWALPWYLIVATALGLPGVDLITL